MIDLDDRLLKSATQKMKSGFLPSDRRNIIVFVALITGAFIIGGIGFAGGYITGHNTTPTHIHK